MQRANLGSEDSPDTTDEHGNDEDGGDSKDAEEQDRVMIES